MVNIAILSGSCCLYLYSIAIAGLLLIAEGAGRALKPFGRACAL